MKNEDLTKLELSSLIGRYAVTIGTGNLVGAVEIGTEIQRRIIALDNIAHQLDTDHFIGASAIRRALDGEGR